MSAHAAVRFAHALDASLIESLHHPHVSARESALSFLFHATVIAAVASIAPAAKAKFVEVAPEAIAFFHTAAAPPAPPPIVQKVPRSALTEGGGGGGGGAAKANAIVTAPVAKGFQVLVAPIDIPDRLPGIDLTRAVTDEADFSGKGVAGGIAGGVEGGVTVAKTRELQIVEEGAVAAEEQVYFREQVERPVALREGSPVPVYPEHLRDMGLLGEVMVQYVVDTLGRYEEGSMVVLGSTHEAFTTAVRTALPRMRFHPAEVGDRKVKMLVQQPFMFSVQR
jgi:protein TonB